jgi:DNA modification methylase
VETWGTSIQARLIKGKTMTQIQFLQIENIKIQERARQVFSEEGLSKLQTSLADPEVGLLHPIIVSADMQLVTGERRLRAISALHFLETPVKFNGQTIPPNTIPAIVCSDSREQVELLKMELEENINRENFTYQEEVQLTARIARVQEALRRTKTPSIKNEKPKPIIQVDDIPIAGISKEAVKEAAKVAFPNVTDATATSTVKTQLAVAHVLETLPDSPLAKQLKAAKNGVEAEKVLQRHAKEETRAQLAASQGKNFNSKVHTIIHGDCLVELPKLTPNFFDVCVTDPIYGIDANKFGDAAGKLSSKRHDYDDSYETWQRVMPEALKMVSKLLKPAAHIYLACDFDRFHELKKFLLAADDNWKIQRAPIIQFKTEGGRVPHPGFTCRRSYECWLYAYRGGKQEYNMINDVIPCSSDRTETHGAGKPIGLLKTFLRRSAMPGDRVLDFMAGSGTIITAAHELNLRCTAIELSQVDYGRCLERIKELV